MRNDRQHSDHKWGNRIEMTEIGELRDAIRHHIQNFFRERMKDQYTHEFLYWYRLSDTLEEYFGVSSHECNEGDDDCIRNDKKKKCYWKEMNDFCHSRRATETDAYKNLEKLLQEASVTWKNICDANINDEVSFWSKREALERLERLIYFELDDLLRFNDEFSRPFVKERPSDKNMAERRFFWFRYFGMSSRSIDADRFIKALLLYLKYESKDTKINERLFTLIMNSVCDLNDNSRIEPEEWTEFCFRYGPIATMYEKASGVYTVEGKVSPWYTTEEKNTCYQKLRENAMKRQELDAAALDDETNAEEQAVWRPFFFIKPKEWNPETMGRPGFDDVCFSMYRYDDEDDDIKAHRILVKSGGGRKLLVKGDDNLEGYLSLRELAAWITNFVGLQSDKMRLVKEESLWSKAKPHDEDVTEASYVSKLREFFGVGADVVPVRVMADEKDEQIIKSNLSSASRMLAYLKNVRESASKGNVQKRMALEAYRGENDDTVVHEILKNALEEKHGSEWYDVIREVSELQIPLARPNTKGDFAFDYVMQSNASTSLDVIDIVLKHGNNSLTDHNIHLLMEHAVNQLDLTKVQHLLDCKHIRMNQVLAERMMDQSNGNILHTIAKALPYNADMNTHIVNDEEKNYHDEENEEKKNKICEIIDLIFKSVETTTPYWRKKSQAFALNCDYAGHTPAMDAAYCGNSAALLRFRQYGAKLDQISEVKSQSVAHFIVNHVDIYTIENIQSLFIGPCSLSSRINSRNKDSMTPLDYIIEAYSKKDNVIVDRPKLERVIMCFLYGGATMPSILTDRGKKFVQILFSMMAKSRFGDLRWEIVRCAVMNNDVKLVNALLNPTSELKQQELILPFVLNPFCKALPSSSSAPNIRSEPVNSSNNANNDVDKPKEVLVATPLDEWDLKEKAKIHRVSKKTWTCWTSRVKQMVECEHSLLHLAVVKGNVDIVELLLAHKPDKKDVVHTVNDIYREFMENDSMQRTHTEFDSFDAFRSSIPPLLRKRLQTVLHCLQGDINITNASGQSALHIVAMKSSVTESNNKIAELLLRKKINVGLKDSINRNALHYAADMDQLEIAEMIAPSQVDLDIVSGGRANFELDLSSMLKQKKMKASEIHKQAKEKAELDMKERDRVAKSLKHAVKDDSGFTALHYASRNGNWKVVSFLLNKGASVDLPSTYGFTPLALCMERKQRSVREFKKLCRFNPDLREAVRQYIKKTNEKRLRRFETFRTENSVSSANDSDDDDDHDDDDVYAVKSANAFGVPESAEISRSSAAAAAGGDDDCDEGENSVAIDISATNEPSSLKRVNPSSIELNVLGKSSSNGEQKDPLTSLNALLSNEPNASVTTAFVAGNAHHRRRDSNASHVDIAAAFEQHPDLVEHLSDKENCSKAITILLEYGADVNRAVQYSQLNLDKLIDVNDTWDQIESEVLPIDYQLNSSINDTTRSILEANRDKIFANRINQIVIDEKYQNTIGNKLLIRVISYFLLLVLITYVCLVATHDVDAHWIRQSLINSLITNEYPEHVATTGLKRSFTEIDDINEYYLWAKGNLVDVFYPEEKDASVYWDGDEKIARGANFNVSGGYALMQLRVIGTPRLRQVRSYEEPCDLGNNLNQLATTCFTSKESSERFGPPTFSKYQGASELGSIWKYGIVDCYDGGGFVYNFPSLVADNITDVRQQVIDDIQLLQDNNWIDAKTRAVFFEFAVFNPNEKIYMVGSISLELPTSGGVVPSYLFDVAKITVYFQVNGSNARFYPEFFLVLLMLIRFYSLIVRICRERALNDIAEWLMNVLFFFAVGLHIYIVIKGDEVNQLNNNAYPKVQLITQVYKVQRAVLSFVVFVAWVNFINYLTIIRNVLDVVLLVRQMFSTLAALFAIFINIIVAFTFAELVIYGEKESSAYKLEFAVLTRLSQAFAGRPVDAFLTRNRAMGSIYDILFLLTVPFLLLNLIIAVMASVYQENKEKFESSYWAMHRFKLITKNGAHPLGIVEYIADKVFNRGKKAKKKSKFEEAVSVLVEK